MFKSLKDNYNYIPGDGSSPPLVAYDFPRDLICFCVCSRVVRLLVPPCLPGLTLNQRLDPRVFLVALQGP